METEQIKELLMKYWKNIAINIFEWRGLEDISPSLTSQIIEETLFEKGKCLFFNDNMLGYMALQVTPANRLNVYGKPENYTAIGLNYTKSYTVENSVLIKNNSLETPTRELLEFYCSKLADIEQTKDIRRDSHKTPFMLECTEDTLLTAKNIFKKIKTNEPAIFKNKTRGEGDVGVNAINLGVEYLNDRLEDEYNCYVSKILTFLGLDNYVEDKAERVQTAEVDSNNEYIISCFRASLLERKKACEKINKMFGINLSVDYVQAQQIEVDEPVEDVEEVEDV